MGVGGGRSWCVIQQLQPKGTSSKYTRTANLERSRAKVSTSKYLYFLVLCASDNGDYGGGG